MLESEEILFPSLWKVMAGVSDGLYQWSLGIWDDYLLDYNYSISWDDDILNYSILCISDKSQLNIKKGLLI
jgi:hypothetical protein